MLHVVVICFIITHTHTHIHAHTPLQSQFAEGNVVIMQSKASGRSLRLHNGQVQGTGGRGQFGTSFALMLNMCTAFVIIIMYTLSQVYCQWIWHVNKQQGTIEPLLISVCSLFVQLLTRTHTRSPVEGACAQARCGGAAEHRRR